MPVLALRACPCPFGRRLRASARVRHRCPVPAAGGRVAESLGCAYVRASRRGRAGGGSGVRSGLVLMMDACMRACVGQLFLY